jgi:hypothetical protein
MFKKLTLSLLLLTVVSPCYAQNARRDDVAMQLVTQNTSAGTVSFLKPVPGAVITLGRGTNSCSVTNTPTGSTANCAPLAPICLSDTDAICGQPNPTNADSSGNYGFWVQPGRFVAAITGIGVNGRVITYDLPVGIIGAGPANLPNGVSGIGPRFQQFTSSGTFTIPASVTVVKVTVVGAGGGGGGSDAGATFNGGGGGSGGCGIKWLTGLTSGNTLTVTIGTGGTVTSGAAGGNGVASSVASGTQTITTITANGGAGGSSGSGTLIGGNGGVVGTGGDINLAGVTAPNAAPIATMGNWGGLAAPSILGGGSVNTFAAVGVAGTAPGAGGGGAGGGAARAGGVGANGIVIFEWVN